MTELIVTLSVLLAPFIVPTYTSWKHANWKGVLVGSLTLWAFLFLAQGFLLGFYGSGGPAGVALVLWVIGGWFPSFFYCGFVALIKKWLKKT